MTVKSGTSRVGNLYAIQATPSGRGDSSMKKKMGFLSQANLDVSHTFICPFELVCTKIRLHFAAI